MPYEHCLCRGQAVAYDDRAGGDRLAALLHQKRQISAQPRYASEGARIQRNIGRYTGESASPDHLALAYLKGRLQVIAESYFNWPYGIRFGGRTQGPHPTPFASCRGASRMLLRWQQTACRVMIS